MSRIAATLFLVTFLLLSGCQRGAETETTTAEVTAAPAASAPATPAPATSPAGSPAFDVEPFGIASCDAFVAAMNQCFATSKAHPSAAQILRPSYEQEFQRWHRMKEEPAMAKMVEKVCQTQLDVIAEVKKGLECS